MYHQEDDTNSDMTSDDDMSRTGRETPPPRSVHSFSGDRDREREREWERRGRSRDVEPRDRWAYSRNPRSRPPQRDLSLPVISRPRFEMERDDERRSMDYESRSQDAESYQNVVGLKEDKKTQNPIQDNLENYRKLLSLGVQLAEDDRHSHMTQGHSSRSKRSAYPSTSRDLNKRRKIPTRENTHEGSRNNNYRDSVVPILSHIEPESLPGEASDESKQDVEFSVPSSSVREHQKARAKKKYIEFKSNETSVIQSLMFRELFAIRQSTKLFECQECGQAFVQKSDLIEHQKIHDRERPSGSRHYERSVICSLSPTDPQTSYAQEQALKFQEFGQHSSTSNNLSAEKISAQEKLHAEEPHATETHSQETNVQEIHAEEPHAKETNVQEIDAEEPHAKETSVQEIDAEEPHAKETSVQEIHAEEPHAKETSVQEIHAEEPHAMETNVQEIDAEEPHATETHSQETSVQEIDAEEPHAMETSGQEIDAEEPHAMETSVQEIDAEEPHAMETIHAEEPHAKETSGQKTNGQEIHGEEPHGDGPSSEEPHGQEKSEDTTTQSSGSNEPQKADTIYECQCGLGFADLTDLTSHQDVHSRKCLVDSREYKHSEVHVHSVSEFEKKYSGEKLYECPKCGESFIHSSFLFEHQRIHEEDQLYSVKGCDDGLLVLLPVRPRKNRAQERDPAVAGSAIRCRQCGQGFIHSSALNEHMRHHRDDEALERSELAEEVFVQSLALTEYQGSETEAEEKRFECTICGECFITAKQLGDHHTKVHKDEPYEYGPSYTHASFLTEPPRKHLPLYECKDCGQPFVDDTIITEHVVFHPDGEGEGEIVTAAAQEVEANVLIPQEVLRIQGSNAEAAEPEVEAAEPEVEAAEPEVEAAEPNGEAEGPEGEAAEPDGEAEQPNGEAEQPNGDADEPDGAGFEDPEERAEEPEEDVEEPEGDADEPDGAGIEDPEEEGEDQEIEVEEPYYNCHECTGTFASSAAFGEHLKTHASVIIFEPANALGECSGYIERAGTSAGGADQADEKYFKCDVCGQLFNDRLSLARHQNSHTG